MGARGSRPGRTRRPRPIGFGIHQGVELLLGVFVLLTVVRMPEPDIAPVITLGMVLVVLPVITVGPLAAVRLLRPAAHRVLDVVLVMLALAGPLLPLGLDAAAIPVVVLAGLGLAVLTRSTSYAVRQRPPPPAPLPPPPPPAWARDLGTAAGRARAQLPRHAGRVVGRLKKGRGPAS
jgi:hypothetical protein